MSDMSSAENCKRVRVHDTGRLEDGTVFDSSQGREPLEFTLGAGQVIAGFERAVEGMQVGETKNTLIPVDEAYGPHREDLLLEVDRNQMPEDIELEVGTMLQLQQRDGQAAPVRVAALAGESVTVEARHPPAGEGREFPR